MTYTEERVKKALMQEKEFIAKELNIFPDYVEVTRNDPDIYIEREIVADPVKQEIVELEKVSAMINIYFNPDYDCDMYKKILNFLMHNEGYIVDGVYNNSIRLGKTIIL